MKKIAFLILVGFVMSCSKDSIEINVENVQLSKGEVYERNLGYFGFEGDGPRIAKQAENFEISEIKATGFDEVIYTYKPQADFVGTDSVKIEILVGADGHNPPNSVSRVINLNFEIKESN